VNGVLLTPRSTRRREGLTKFEMLLVCLPFSVALRHQTYSVIEVVSPRQQAARIRLSRAPVILGDWR